MANSPNAGGEKRPFAEIVRQAPRHEGGTVSLTGRVCQSDKEGHFVLDLGGGQTLELPVQAVRDYHLQDEGVVRLDLKAHELERFKPVVQDLQHKQIWQEYQTLHVLDALNTGVWDAKVGHSDLLNDPTIPQGPGQGPDPTRFGPGAAGGATPFTLATAHHAPQNALAMQMLSGQVGQATLKEATQDVRTTPITDLTTVKESVHDTLKEITKDPIFDTVKEVYETLVEGGGTIQEGGGGTLVEGGGFPGQGGFNPGY
jgi:hypothetical protein